MKRVLLLTTIGVMFCVALSQAQNVFDPNDPIIRYSSGAALGTPQKPDPGIGGLQKWVSTASSGVSSGNGRFDASSFKAYYINFMGNRMPFRIKFPRSYTNPDSAGKTYPAMLFMHGAGEPGCDANNGLYQNERQLLHGGNLFRQRVDNNEFDGFLLYPQVYVGGSGCWSDWGTPGGSPPSNGHFDAILAMIDSMFKYVRLDRDRLVLTGLSNGGAADWNITAYYPQWVAKNSPSAAATGATNYADFVHIPIWFASGGKDTNPNPGFSNGTYTSIQNAGGDIKFTLFPDLGHSVWYQHWQLPGFVEWMNDLHKANPLIYFGRDEFCPSETVDARLGISPGYYQYEWQKDGVTIATATATAINPVTNGMNYTQPRQKYTNYTFSGVNNSVIASITGNTITVREHGTYRVRFKRKNTDAFTVWSPKPAVVGLKSLTQTPPITINLTDGLRSKVLPAPDGSTTVPLILPTGFISYQWYRNDAQVDTGRFINAIPGVYKAKANEQFGCGSIFSPTFNVVAANGEPKPDPATNLTATVENLIDIRLNWNQNPNAGTNETGFEIYKSTGGSGGPYKLLAVTGPDVTTYVDENQQSNANFYYIVRAVGDFGASAITNEATAFTPADNLAPTPPAGLVAACVTREKVTLNWTASTDNVGVAVYDIYINGLKSYSTPNTRFEIYQLSPLTQYAFTVKAKDAAGNSSQPSNQVAAYTRQQGVCYKVYAGNWNELPDFNTLVPVKEGMSANIDLSVRPAGTNDHFGFLWEGHATRTLSNSTHQFQICSDDGSRLYWNGYYNPNSNGTINNDGLHGDQCAASGNISLSSNTPYPFALAFFEKDGGEVIRFQWRTSGSFANIPNAAFNQGSTPGGAPNAPSGLSANAVSSSQINLSWTDNSNNETGFEIVRATAAAGPFVPRATVTGNSFQDTGLTASTQYWYQVRSVNVAGQSNYTSPAATATTQPPPPPPTAPSNLIASATALQTVQLQWNDNSNNETAFEIWRSVGNNTNFTLLATVAGGAGAQKMYVDAPVFANVQYFYIVRAIGSPTPSAYTNEANASTANSAPVINTVPDFTVRQGGSVTIPITASDMDSDPLSFSIPGLPYFATIQNVSNGNANLVVSPPEGEQGGFTLRAIVDDGFGGKDTARFTIVVNDNSLPVLNPINDVSINEGDSVTIALTATDAEMNQYMVWTFQNKPTWGTFTNNGNGTGSLKLKPGYSASGIYNMTVIVDDGFGAWTSRSFNIVVNETDPNETIQVNMRYFTGFQALWNDVPLFGVSTFNVNNLINKKGQNSGAGIRYLAGGGPITASDAGMQPGGTGIFPDAIMKDVLQIGHNGGTRSGQIQVYGLDPNKKYNLVFFASINTAVAANEPWRGYNANTRTIYTVGAQTAEVRVLGNTNNTDTIYQVQPNASGQITFTMAGDPGSPGVGALLNAMVIDAQFDDGTTPAKPTNIQAQVIPNVGVRLTWNDISYNENSYRIFRATSRSGPYTTLTPDALKDSINYIDPNVAPYTQYYYFVRGVNHLGLGTSSDTAAAITGNNKPVISGLDNMFVKTGNSVQDDFTVTDNPSDIITVTILNQPSFVTITPQGGNTYRITANPTVDNIGFHFLTVQATDNNGGLATQQITLSVADASTRSVYVNFAYNVPAPTPWNNIMGYGNQGTTLNNLRDETNTTTPFGIQLVDGWDGVTDLGHRTGNNSGVFPDSVLAGGIWDFGTRQDGGTELRVRFTGLNNAMRYNLVFVGSQNEGYTSNTRYWVTGGPSDTLNARNNTNSTANLNGLTPVGGEITVNITKLSGNYTFLNGVQIEEFAPAITLMNPINLYVEGRTDRTSAALTWSDRSNNEISFTVQRATDENFTQNLQSQTLNAGAASLINSGLTAGLTNNTKYWYRVRANGPGGTTSAWSNKKAVITPQSIVYVNFNFSVNNGSSPWNNLEALPNFVNSFSGLLNQSNQPSGMTLAIEKIFNGEYAFGIRTGNNSGVVPDNVMEASYWIDRSQIATVRLTGLNQAKRYRIGFTGGIDNALFSGDMTMSYTIGQRTVYLNSFFNTTKMVYIADVQPDQNGEVLITFSTPARESVVYGFTSAIIVQAYDDVQGGGTQTNSVNQDIVRPDVVLQTNTITVPEVSLQGVDMETRMYPNPFVDQINLEFNNTSAGNHIAVDVYDMTGRVVYRRNFGSIPAGANTLRLNTTEGKLNTGVYMVTLKVNGLPVQSTKMIKDRK